MRANADVIYRAFCNAKALESWLVPDNMTGKIHQFDWREGGGYQMSLFYHGHINHEGKTTNIEDRFITKLITLKPAEEIVMSVRFDSDHPQFKGDMILKIYFVSKAGGTEVRFYFEHIPVGIRPEDNETGTQQSLEKLALYVEQGTISMCDNNDEINEQDSDGSANAFQWK
ncbi:MAG: SRPBCC domain-containing protein [Agriterribacter sp.]